MIIFLSPFWEPITARCLYLQDRILTTQAAVSGITGACDVRHSEGEDHSGTKHGVHGGHNNKRRKAKKRYRIFEKYFHGFHKMERDVLKMATAHT